MENSKPADPVEQLEESYIKCEDTIYYCDGKVVNHRHNFEPTSVRLKFYSRVNKAGYILHSWSVDMYKEFVKHGYHTSGHGRKYERATKEEYILSSVN